MKLSILIPVFNEEKTISEIIKKVISVRIAGVEKEIIIIDDGSTDSTLGRIPKKEVTIIKHKKNLGKGAAVKSGIGISTGEYIIIQDADLEYDPTQIKTLVKEVLEKNAEVVYGTRLRRLPHLRKEEKKLIFLIHFFGNRFLSAVTSILYGNWLTDIETCYKLFPASFGKKVTLRSKRFDFEPEITAKLLKAGYKIKEIPIVTTPRDYSEGKKLRTFHDGPIALYTLLKYRIYD